MLREYLQTLLCPRSLSPAPVSVWSQHVFPYPPIHRDEMPCTVHQCSIDLTWPLSVLHLPVAGFSYHTPWDLSHSGSNTWLSSFSNGQPAGESSAHPESPPGSAQNHSDHHEIPLCLPQSVSRLPSKQLGQTLASATRSLHTEVIYCQFLQPSNY